MHLIRSPYLPVAFAVAGATLLLDVLTPLGFAAGIPYMMAITVAAAAERRLHLLLVTAICLVLTVVGYHFSPGETGTLALANRILTVAMIVAAAAHGLRSQHREARFRDALLEERSHFFEHSLDLLLIGGFDGYIRQASPSLVDLLGYDEKTIMQKPFISHVVEEDRSGTWKSIRSVAQGQQVASFRHRIVTRDGAIRWIEWSSPAKLPEGDVFYSAGRDITAQLEQEEELRRAREFLWGTIDSLDAHLCILDDAGRIVMVNRAWRDFAAANGANDDDAFVGASYVHTCARASDSSRGDASRTAAGVRDVLAGRRASFDMQYACHAPHEKRWFHCRVTPFAFGGKTWLTVSHENITQRHLAEERQVRYTELIESTSDFVGIAGVDRRVRFLNRAGRLLVGIGEGEDVSSMTISEFHSESVTHLLEQEAFPAALRDGTWTGEAALMTRDGMEIPVWMVIVAHQSNEGKIEYLSTVSRDLREVKLADYNNQQLAAIVASSSDAIVGTDVNGIITSWNDAAARIYGYTADEAVGQPITLTTPDDRHREVEANLYRLERGERIRALETVRRRKDGSLVDVSISICPVRDGEGRVTGTASIARDITERRKVERRLLEQEMGLRQARQRLRSVLDSTAEAICGLDLEGICVFANAACVRMLGYEKEADLLGKDMDSLFHHSGPVELPDNLACPIGVASRHGIPFHTDNVSFQRRDGTRFPAECWSHPVHEEETLVGSVITFLDVTDRLQAEEELREKDAKLRHAQRIEAVGSLAGGIAHEFNNLLQVISGYGSFALAGLETDDPRHADLEQVLKAAERASTLTSQLLSFSRRNAMCCETVDLNKLVDDLASMLRPLLGERIRLATVLSPLPLRADCDSSLLHQALMNLCVNARDAMPDGGKLRLEIAHRTGGADGLGPRDEKLNGEFAVITVSDSGTGMSAIVRERMFEPFFTTKDVGKGTGLGLSMAYGVVSELGGTIDVQTEIGRGTRFQITLPLGTSHLEPATTETNAPKAANPGVILLAEDEALVRVYLKRVLQRAGYEVLPTENGEEAIRLLEQQGPRIDLLLLDVVMPERNGIEVVKHIRKQRCDLPVVFCSGYAPNSPAVSSVLGEGMRVVRKPVSESELLSAVYDALHPQVQGEHTSENGLLLENVLEQITVG